MLHASQPVPTAQWPELAARSFSWLVQTKKWLRMHQGDGLNVLHVSQLVPTAQWPELAARFFSWLWQILISFFTFFYFGIQTIQLH